MLQRFFVDPYEASYYLRALIQVVALGALGAVVGVHVLLRRMAFLTEALQHTVFPGIAIAFAVGSSLLVGASIAAAVSVALVVVLVPRSRLDHDAVLALLVSTFFAVGVVVVSRRTGYTSDLNALLFGRITTVSWRQIVETAVLGATCVTVLVVLHKELVLRAFDPGHSEALGYRATVLDLVLHASVAIAVVVAVQSLGTVLIVAFLVTPAAAGRLASSSVAGAMVVGAAFAGLLGWVGLSISYEASVHHDLHLAAGATVVLTYTVGFVVVALGAWLWRRTRRPDEEPGGLTGPDLTVHVPAGARAEWDGPAVWVDLDDPRRRPPTSPAGS